MLTVHILATVLCALLAGAGGRSARSGGFPKFPGVPPPGERVGPQCGTRAVPHLPTRPGSPASRIVGGTQPPYGAYPWQVTSPPKTS